MPWPSKVLHVCLLFKKVFSFDALAEQGLIRFAFCLRRSLILMPWPSKKVFDFDALAEQGLIRLPSVKEGLFAEIDTPRRSEIKCGCHALTPCKLIIFDYKDLATSSLQASLAFTKLLFNIKIHLQEYSTDQSFSTDGANCGRPKNWANPQDEILSKINGAIDGDGEGDKRFFRLEHDESYQMLRNRKRRQVYLHDYAEEYYTTTDYGKLVIQQQLHIVHWIIENLEITTNTLSFSL
ncbi:hypothetical protein LguiB_030199 [Lonicera macranthoides]